jgi:hypothetical protein
MSRLDAAAVALMLCAVAGCSRAPQSTADHTTAGIPAALPAPPPHAEASPPPAGENDLPPLPITPFPAARPMPVVRAIYTFAATHPEVLRKVPCFCGCESRGHGNNDDCFVAARDAKGRVTAWEPHGVG